MMLDDTRSEHFIDYFVMDKQLQQIADDIVQYDPDLFGTLTELAFGDDNNFKLKRILRWGNQWQTLNQKHTTEKPRQGRS